MAKKIVEKRECLFRQEIDQEKTETIAQAKKSVSGNVTSVKRNSQAR
jgi:hypothetical protein